jgi:hypothetical protein
MGTRSLWSVARVSRFSVGGIWPPRLQYRERVRNAVAPCLALASRMRAGFQGGQTSWTL